MDASKVIEIFIAYSRKDTEFLNELKTFLWPLERNKLIKIWYDGEIIPGQVWENEIKQALHTAEIFLLLVSANSLASDYFYNKEVSNALERHHKGESVVVPVILKPCGWRETELALLQALPQNGKPLTLWNNKDEAYESIYDGLKSTIKKIQDKNNLKNNSEEEQKLQKNKIDYEQLPEQEEGAQIITPIHEESNHRIDKLPHDKFKAASKKWLIPAVIFLILLVSIYFISSRTKKEEGHTASGTEKAQQDSLDKAKTVDTSQYQTKSVKTVSKNSNITPGSTEKKAEPKNVKKQSTFEFKTFADALSFVLADAKNNFANIIGETIPNQGPGSYKTKVVVYGGFFQEPPDILYGKDEWVYTGKFQWAFRFFMRWTFTGKDTYDQMYLKETFDKADKIIQDLLIKNGINFDRKYRQWRTPDPKGSLLYLFPPYRIELNQDIWDDRFIDELIICHTI